jgi:hypothetical protein
VDVRLREQGNVRDQARAPVVASVDDRVLVLEKDPATQVVGQVQPEVFPAETEAMVNHGDIGLLIPTG